MSLRLGRPVRMIAGIIAPVVIVVAFSAPLAVPVVARAGTLDRASQSTVRVVVDLGDGNSGSGSGAILDRNHVLTAAHVVKGAQDAAIILTNGKQYGFTVEWSDATMDIALLKTEDLPVEPIEIGDSTALSAGDVVWAVGYPLGLEKVSVTKGVVSSAEQEIDGQTYIQTDASINPGNSGGPLVDEKGRFVGTNVSRGETSADGRVVEGMGFAVPAAVTQRFVGKYLATSAGSSPGAGGGSQAAAEDPFNGSGAEWKQGGSSGSGGSSTGGGGSTSKKASSGGGSAGIVLLVLVLLVMVGGAAALAFFMLRRRRPSPGGAVVDDWGTMSAPPTAKGAGSRPEDDWGGPIGPGSSPVDDWLR